MNSNLKRFALPVTLAFIVLCAWVRPLDNLASERIDQGFTRALTSFATARLVGAVISVAQGTDVGVQPFGVGVKLAVGQALRPVSELVAQFAELMLMATVIFGAMKVLLAIGGSVGVSLALTLVALGVAWRHWRARRLPVWTWRFLAVLVLIRFALPVVMVGSDAIFREFMADDYMASQSALSGSTAKLESDAMLSGAAKGQGGQGGQGGEGGVVQNAKDWLAKNIDISGRIDALRQSAAQITAHIIKLIVVFLLQTLVIPLLLFWALYRALMAMLPIGRAAKPAWTAGG